MASRTGQRRVLTMGVFALAAMIGAGGAARAEVSQADKDACTPDVWRLCASDVPFVSAIVSCLNRKIDRLSPECRSVMQGGSVRTARRRKHVAD